MSNHDLECRAQRPLWVLELFSQASQPALAGELVYLCLIMPPGVVEKTQLTRRFLIRKQEEYDALVEEIAELEAELSEKRLWLTVLFSAVFYLPAIDHCAKDHWFNSGCVYLFSRRGALSNLKRILC